MKFLKLLPLFIALLMISSCEREEAFLDDDSTHSAIEESALVESDKSKRCGAKDRIDKMIIENPEALMRRKEIAEYTESYVEEEENDNKARVVTVPVIVHVLYNNQRQNISNALIQSQIRASNLDLTRRNSDWRQTNPRFKKFVGRANIKLKLDRVIRKKTNVKRWNDRNEENIFNSRKGGSDIINPRKFVNVYVVNYAFLGSALPPEFAGDPTDGIIISNDAFGVGGPLNDSSYDLGRTLTHELGHYFNLEHIWGPNDRRCNEDDGVKDTPLQANPSEGCPRANARSCGSFDMTMNFMDFSDDECLLMFTKGQARRMRAALNGPRKSLK